MGPQPVGLFQNRRHGEATALLCLSFWNYNGQIWALSFRNRKLGDSMVAPSLRIRKSTSAASLGLVPIQPLWVGILVGQTRRRTRRAHGVSL